MQIEELKNELRALERKGYSIEINNIIEENLKEHIRRCIKQYNVLNIAINNKEFTFYKGERHEWKEFSEIEDEVKQYFQQFKVEDRLLQLVRSIRVWTQSAYDLKGTDKAVLLDRYHKSSLLELHSDKIIVNVYTEKDKYSQNSWTLRSGYEVGGSLRELFKLLLNIDIETSFFKYTVDALFFQTPHVSAGFTFKFFKNGKLEVYGNQSAIDTLNKVIRKFFTDGREAEYVLVL